jgi:hypothetical protein
VVIEPLEDWVRHYLYRNPPLTFIKMRRRVLRAEIVVSARINVFAGTSEIFDRVVQLGRFTFPRGAVAVESGDIEEA